MSDKVKVNYALEMAKRLLTDSIWKSANLEGLGTTFPKTDMILENLPTDTTREEVMFIVNMKRAWNFLFESLSYYNNSLSLFRELNKLVGLGYRYGSGELRSVNISVEGTSWTPSIPNTTDIYNVITELEMIEDVELKALKYFCFIARAHIFAGGNMRVAQLMANKVLIEKGVGIFQITVEAQSEFKNLLLEYYESNDDTDIRAFMLRYCIQRVNAVTEKYPVIEEAVIEFKDIGATRNFLLSTVQIGILDKVLMNLRKLLKSYNLTGTWILHEKDMVVYLEGKDGCVGLYMNGDRLNFYVLNGIFSRVDSGMLLSFIEKTLSLLESRVPFSIKRISFSLNCRNFSMGEIFDSEESGSIEVALR